MKYRITRRFGKWAVITPERAIFYFRTYENAIKHVNEAVKFRKSLIAAT